MNQKGFINILLIVIVVALIGIGGYFTLREQTESPLTTADSTTSPTSTSTSPISSTSTSDLPVQKQPVTSPPSIIYQPPQQSQTSEEKSPDFYSWKQYTDSGFGLSFSYPSNWGDPMLVKKAHSDGYHTLPGLVYRYQRSINLSPVLVMNIYSRDYSPPQNEAGQQIFNKTRINTDWNIEEFSTNMGFPNSDPYKGGIMLVKKLSEKSVLVAVNYTEYCSSGLSLYVLTPFRDDYPNIEIPVETHFEEDLPEDSRGICANIYYSQFKAIIDKIKSDSYSKELINAIKTAQQIADSVTDVRR